MFQLSLFKIRAFAAGNAASLIGSIARGGLQFMLIIWLAGIWLPLHGYDFSDTLLWAGIDLLPLNGGFLIAGLISGTCPTGLAAPVRHLRRAAGRALFRGAGAAPGPLPLLAVRPDDLGQRARFRACSPRRTPPRS